MPVVDNCDMECILYPYACLSPGLRKGLEEKNRYVIIKLQTEDAVQSLAIPGAVYKSKKRNHSLGWDISWTVTLFRQAQFTKYMRSGWFLSRDSRFLRCGRD